jgi:hypothetical protein
MNADLTNIRNLLRVVRSELMQKQNVVATGIGYKTVAGQVTSDLAIICSVEVKKSRARLSQQDLIPAAIQTIPTDVKPTGALQAFQDPRARLRPAPGGTSIGHHQITAGTFGCLVKKDNDLYILSNNHVLANSNAAAAGDSILQPGPADGGRNPQDQIAVLSDFAPIHFEGEGGDSSCNLAGWVAAVLNNLSAWVGSTTRLRTYRVQQPGNKTDCAIAKPLNVEDVNNAILQVGIITNIRDGELGMKIKKSGRTTGLTTGVIEQVDVTARVNFGINKIALFEDQLLAGAMSQGGDSGSAVLSEDNELVGLLFAGSATTTIINRISHVFNSLKVTLP